MKAAQYIPQLIASLSPTPAMEIRLTSKHTVFTTGQTIEGELTLPRRNTTQYARISVALIGRTTTSIMNSLPFPNSGSTMDDTFLQMHHTETLKASHDQRIFPFSFVIPDALPFDSCSEKIPSGNGHLQLPPSVDYSSDRFCPEMCSVVYYIHAEVVIGKERLHATRQVQLLPLYPEQPPRFGADGEDNETHMSDSTALRLSLLGAKMGRVTVRAREAKPLYLPPDQPHHGSTIAPIRLDLVLSRLHPDPGFPADCQVKVTLEAVTYFTALPMVKLPTSQGQLFSASMCSWKNKSIGLTWSGNKDDSHSSSIVVPIPVPSDTSVIPTFHHCYVAREYFAKVELTVGYSRTLRIKVPVQIYNSLPN